MHNLLNYLDFVMFFCKESSCDLRYDLFSGAEQNMVAHTSPAASVGYRMRRAADFLLAATTPTRAAVPIAPACSATLVFSMPTDLRVPG